MPPHHRHDHRGHTQGAIDPGIAATKHGIWAVKWFFIGLCSLRPAANVRRVAFRQRRPASEDPN
jgi:hypothetical protein